MRNPNILVILLASQLILACSGSQQPTVLRIGVLPDQSQETLQTRYDMLLKRLQHKTGLETRLVIPDNYAQLLSLFQENKVDLAYFGGATFVKASDQSQAVPLVMRDVDTRFTSYFIVAAGDNRDSLREYQGKSLSFGAKLSTSGHFMPRFFLTEKQITPETFFSQVQYSGAHDKTAYLVRDRKVDVGAANAQVIDHMFAKGLLLKSDVRILWQTPPYPDYVWAIQKNISEELKEKIRWTFLDLRAQNQEDKTILDALGTEGFLPARESDFQALKTIIQKTQL